MATKIQLRHGTAAAWTSADPVLAVGEIGVETDTEKLKLGDGSTAWIALGYIAIDSIAHALGGSKHTSDTLSALNNLISDANLVDTADSRFSDSRKCDNTFDTVATARTNLDVYNKSEVDGKVVGLYDHKGSYDAGANSPDLDVSPSGILKADTYTVSVAGSFFTESVEIGDILIADQDSPTALSHWTRVNKNISFGTTAGTACEGNDNRLSDNRTDTTAIHDNVGSEISAITEKTSPVAADLVLIEDSEASNAKKKVQIGNLIKKVLFVKPTDESVASSETFQTDDHLKFSVLNGETWEFEIHLFVSEATSNPNIKLRIHNSDGLTGTIRAGWFVAGQSVGGALSAFDVSSGGINLTTSVDMITIQGSMTATADGTVELQWAQNTSDVDATIVHALSKLKAQRA